MNCTKIYLDNEVVTKMSEAEIKTKAAFCPSRIIFFPIAKVEDIVVRCKL